MQTTVKRDFARFSWNTELALMAFGENWHFTCHPMTLQAGICLFSARAYFTPFWSVSPKVFVLRPPVSRALASPWPLPGSSCGRFRLEQECGEHRRPAGHCMTAQHPGFSPKAPYPHCKLSQKIYSDPLSILHKVYSPRFPAIWFRGQVLSHKQAEPCRSERGPNAQCHGRGEKCSTTGPANFASHGL